MLFGLAGVEERRTALGTVDDGAAESTLHWETETVSGTDAGPAVAVQAPVRLHEQKLLRSLLLLILLHLLLAE